ARLACPRSGSRVRGFEHWVSYRLALGRAAAPRPCDVCSPTTPPTPLAARTRSPLCRGSDDALAALPQTPTAAPCAHPDRNTQQFLSKSPDDRRAVRSSSVSNLANPGDDTISVTHAKARDARVASLSVCGL